MENKTASSAHNLTEDSPLAIPAKVIAVSIYVFLIGIPMCMLVIGVPVVVFQILALLKKAWAAKTNSVLFILFLVVQIFGLFNLAARGPMGRGGLAFLLMFVTMVLNGVTSAILSGWAKTIRQHHARIATNS